jgi:hypothetical protein
MSPTKKAAKKPPAKKAAPSKKPVAKPKPAAKPAAKKLPPPKEKPVKKAAAPPAAPAKKPAPAAAPAPKAEAAAKEKPSAAKPAPAKKAGKPRPRAQVLPDLVKPGLGGRWECFSCGSKFYDLGRPEPTCPKCGADQRDKPREAKSAAPSPPAERQRRAAVPMGSLLDDEEEAPAEDYEGDEEDLGIDDDAFLAETPEAADDEDDVDVGSIEED